MSQLNLIIGPVQPQEYDEAQERETEREQKKLMLKAYEDKWKVVRKISCVLKYMNMTNVFIHLNDFPHLA